MYSTSKCSKASLFDGLVITISAFSPARCLSLQLRELCLQPRLERLLFSILVLQHRNTRFSFMTLVLSSFLFFFALKTAQIHFRAGFGEVLLQHSQRHLVFHGAVERAEVGLLRWAVVS